MQFFRSDCQGKIHCTTAVRRNQDELVKTFNRVVTGTASEVLGKDYQEETMAHEQTAVIMWQTEIAEKEGENVRWSGRIQENQCTNMKRHEGGQGRMGEPKVCRHQKQPDKKQHQQSIPNCQRSHNAGTGESVGHTGQKWQMSHRRGRHPHKVDGILLRTLQPQDRWRLCSIAL